MVGCAALFCNNSSQKGTIKGDSQRRAKWVENMKSQKLDTHK